MRSVSKQLTQQDGSSTQVSSQVLPTAQRLRALTTMEPRAEVLTVEFKINLLAPAAGERLLVRGRVLRAGRTLTVCRADAVTISEGQEKHVATLTATLIARLAEGS